MRKIATLIIFFLFVNKHYGQTIKDINDVKKMNADQPEANHAFNYSEKQFKTFENLSVLIFKFYKHFISGQDASECSFEPTCSAYMAKSIQHNGFVGGIIDGLDRLQRCNGFDYLYYPRNSENNKLLDAPDRFSKKDGK